MLNQSTSTVFISLAVIAIVTAGIGTGLFAGYFITETPNEQNHGNTSTTGVSSLAYSLILVITTNNFYNSTVGYQPAYFVLNNGTLQSSANISIPANRVIDLTVINYDDGNGTVSSIFTNVTGTLNGKETIYNNTNINSTEGTGQIAVKGGEQVSSVNANITSHTFTVFRNGTVILNIPIVESSVIQASFTLSPGTYSWQCEVACGAGSSGWEGAMDTVGWMSGTLIAQ